MTNATVRMNFNEFFLAAIAKDEKATVDLPTLPWLISSAINSNLEEGSSYLADTVTALQQDAFLRATGNMTLVSLGALWLLKMGEDPLKALQNVALDAVDEEGLLKMIEVQSKTLQDMKSMLHENLGKTEESLASMIRAVLITAPCVDPLNPHMADSMAKQNVMNVEEVLGYPLAIYRVVLAGWEKYKAETEALQG